MRADAGIFILICLLFLVAGAGAVGIPDKLTVTTSKPGTSDPSTWITANNADQATITVIVSNQTSGRVSGVTVNLAVDPLYGTLNPATVTTDSVGTATSIFQVKTKSGAPQIIATNATITDIALSGSVIQNIDHNTPFYDPSFSLPLFIYPQEGVVATEIPFKISMHDRGGNPIDNRRGSHFVTLHVNSPLVPDDCGFKNGSGYTHDISLPLADDGTLTVDVKLTNKTGNNYVQMDSIGDISFKSVIIKAIAGGIPVSLSGSISNNGLLPANNLDRFILDYSLNDVYGNPMANRSIWIHTNISGEETPTLHTSDSNGLIRFYYGPSVKILTANISAVAYDNSSLNNDLIAQFLSTGATNMVLAITPQTLPSRDIPSSQPAQVIGKVTDFFGNPVEGEKVTFRIQEPFTKTPANATVTGEPSFSSTSTVTEIDAITNSDGNAIVYFYPGSFTIQQSDPNYSEKAAGSCYISATWNSLSSQNPPVKMEWKNYPYLTVSVNVTPSNVQVNETVNVAISVTGDGYMMLPRPITVMLDMDASSSLHSGSRGPDAKAASRKFVDNLSPTQDQVGLVSYGDNDNEVFHSNASYNFIQVKQAIDDLTMQGGVSGNAIGVKQSIDEAVFRIVNNPTQHPQEVRAIISLGDSAYSEGELQAILDETWPDNRIHVYTIMFLSSGGGCGSGSDSKLIRMRELAEQAGGKYYCGADPTAIDSAYADIAQTLRSLAGVNATMDCSFTNVEVNSTPMSGGLVFKYVPPTKTTWPNMTVTLNDQSSEWVAPDYRLHFDIGTLHVGEMWKTEYQLKVNRSGLINLFGPGSTILFNNGTEEISLPEVFIISSQAITPYGPQGTLTLADLVPQSGDFTETVPLQWDLKYDGLEQVTETYWYSYNGLPYVEFGSRSGIPSTHGSVVTRKTTLDVTKFPPGDYAIKVIATVPGIPSDSVTGSFRKPSSSEGGTINMQLK